MEKADKVKVLFLSYNGLLEPLVGSQVIPYLERLNGRGFEFVLLTYEKKNDLAKSGKAKILKTRSDLFSKGIEWKYMRYHKNPKILSTLFDLFAGAIYSSYLIITRNVKMVHVRGVTPGSIMIFLSKMFRVKLIFDMRGRLAEEYVGGGLWTYNSIPFRLAKNSEDSLLKIADAVTVLTNKHLEYNKKIPFLSCRNIPMEAIPCCVDLEKFNYAAKDEDGFKKSLGLAGKFVFMYPGKIGSFYLMDQMLDFFEAVYSEMSNAIFFILTPENAGSVLKKASEHGIAGDAIRVLEGSCFEEMPKYYRIADSGIFFINSHEKIGSSPIKMGEFLASGVPVVINAGIGDTAEIVTDNNVGVVIKDFTVPSYEEAARRLLSLKQEGEVLRKRCRDVAERYLSVEKGVEKYYKIYRGLIK